MARRNLRSGRLGTRRLGTGRLSTGRLGAGRLGAGRLGAGRLGAGLVAAVVALAAGCAVEVLTDVPSWALRQPGSGPDIDVAADVAADVATEPPGSGPLRAEPPRSGPSRSELEVVRMDPDAAPPGGTTTVHAFVANRGPDTTASPITVVVHLPKGVTPEGPYFPSGCEVVRGGREVRCVFAPGLPVLRSATALVPVRLDPELRAGRLGGGWVAARSDDDRGGDDHRQPFDLTVAEAAAGA